MKVGDLIKETEYPEMGLIVRIKGSKWKLPYGVLTPYGKVEWFSREYIEKTCEVINEK
jgi:hypothetical protein